MTEIVPVVSVEGCKVTVTVSSVEHPMLPEHFIEWVELETKEGTQRKSLIPGQKAEVTFAITDEVVAAYAYCNLHGLWKS